MANSRKDHKGRKLREGESWRKDGVKMVDTVTVIQI